MSQNTYMNLYTIACCSFIIKMTLNEINNFSSTSIPYLHFIYNLFKCLYTDSSSSVSNICFGFEFLL